MEWSGSLRALSLEIANPNLEMVSNWYPGRLVKQTQIWSWLMAGTQGGLIKQRAVCLGSDETPVRRTLHSGLFPSVCTPAKPSSFQQAHFSSSARRAGGRDWILRNFIPASGATLFLFTLWGFNLFLKVRYNYYIQHYVTSKWHNMNFPCLKTARWLAPFWNNRAGSSYLERFQAEREENRASRGNTRATPALIFWRCSFFRGTARWLYLACFKRRRQ